MKLFWMGWTVPVEPRDETVCEHLPSNILGVWVTGYTDNDEANMAAYVEAENSEKAWSVIEQPLAWPNIGRRRYVSEFTEYTPSTRFVEAEWMKPRLDRWRKRTPEESQKLAEEYITWLQSEHVRRREHANARVLARILQEEFSQAAAPLLAFLQKLDATRHPHWTAVVTAARAELMEGNCTALGANHG